MHLIASTIIFALPFRLFHSPQISLSRALESIWHSKLQQLEWELMSSFIWSTTIRTQTAVPAAGMCTTRLFVAMHIRRCHIGVALVRVRPERVASAKPRHQDILSSTRNQETLIESEPVKVLIKETKFGRPFAANQVFGMEH